MCLILILFFLLAISWTRREAGGFRWPDTTDDCTSRELLPVGPPAHAEIQGQKMVPVLSPGAFLYGCYSSCWLCAQVQLQFNACYSTVNTGVCYYGSRVFTCGQWRPLSNHRQLEQDSHTMAQWFLHCMYRWTTAETVADVIGHTLWPRSILWWWHHQGRYLKAGSSFYTLFRPFCKRAKITLLHSIAICLTLFVGTNAEILGIRGNFSYRC